MRMPTTILGYGHGKGQSNYLVADLYPASELDTVHEFHELADLRVDLAGKSIFVFEHHGNTIRVRISTWASNN